MRNYSFLGQDLLRKAISQKLKAISLKEGYAFSVILHTSNCRSIFMAQIYFAGRPTRRVWAVRLSKRWPRGFQLSRRQSAAFPIFSLHTSQIQKQRVIYSLILTN